jgi:hypothetical protein
MTITHALILVFGSTISPAVNLLSDEFRQFLSIPQRTLILRRYLCSSRLHALLNRRRATGWFRLCQDFGAHLRLGGQDRSNSQSQNKTHKRSNHCTPGVRRSKTVISGNINICAKILQLPSGKSSSYCPIPPISDPTPTPSAIQQKNISCSDRE